jgi:hypothetical protein
MIRDKSECKCKCKHYGSCGAVYGLGFLGALIYFISNATSVLLVFLGILKAFFWPAYLVYYALKFLGI